MKDIVKKSFYITSLFADIKSEHNWTSNEIKTVMLMLSKMSNYKIYIPDFKSKDDIYLEIKKIPYKYIITKKEFLDITNTRIDNISREINKVRKKLVSKIIHTPHPFEDDTDSGESITWFSKITYSNEKGELELELNKYALERLVAFVKYSKITFDNLVKLKSNYSIFTYLFIKIIKDISFNESLSYEILEIKDFKEKLSLQSKYKDINLFRDRVLNVIKEEVNEYTDINLDYELIKEGRAFTKIKFTFDYKPEYLEQKTKQKFEVTKKHQLLENLNISDDDSYNSLFESTLVGWGIRAKKVGELEETYSLDVIQDAIDLTLEEEKAGEIKTTKAAIFLGILENKQLASDEQFEREQQELSKQQEKEAKKALALEYDAIQKVIHDNADEISNYLSAKSINATYEIDAELKEQLINMFCIDAEKFKNFRPKLPVLHNGYYDMKQKKEFNPNMYQFLNIISESQNLKGIK